MVDDGGRMRAHEVRAVSTMVDDGGRELGGTSVLQLMPAERITAYAAIHPLTAPKTTKVPSCWKTPIHPLRRGSNADGLRRTALLAWTSSCRRVDAVGVGQAPHCAGVHCCEVCAQHGRRVGLGEDVGDVVDRADGLQVDDAVLDQLT